MIHSLIIALFGLVLFALDAKAAESPPVETPALTARLITAEDGVAPGARTVSAALTIELADGWKTYWRSPGEVGLPPEVDWSASENVAAAEFMWPAPTRFRAFGIENFGYKDAVVHPVRITLDEPGAPLELRASVSLLACSEVCVPLSFDLELALGRRTGIDRDAAGEIGTWAARVPAGPDASDIALNAAALLEGAQALVVELDRRSRWDAPDVFPELGDGTAFGAPDMRVSEDGRTLWASLPVLALSDPPSPLRITVTDGEDAVTFADVAPAAAAPAPPYAETDPSRPLSALAWTVLIAFAGGAVLNLMPCVLPVLSIKLSSLARSGHRDRRRARTGLLATAAGVLTFMWLLAIAVLALRSLGYAVGWGTQFQNPYFLVLLILLLTVFSASLFGLFEIALPRAVTDRLARVGGSGHSGDFATGALAAVLATPCSAPLLGTAVAFALTGSAVDVLVVFTAMGLGLALPYLTAAAGPGLVSALPRPGRWMVAVRIVLGLMLAGTVAWLLWVLAGVRSDALAAMTLALVVLVVASLALRRAAPSLRGWLLAGAAAGSVAVALLPALTSPTDRGAPEGEAIAWVAFGRAEIARHVSRGHVVFVDVTADWCLTCKANKSLVMERAPVADVLAAPSVIPMQADWTRPDPAILSYLEANGRFGIPFNAVYGPAAPEGILLPELLAPGAVMEAIEAASPAGSNLALGAY